MSLGIELLMSAEWMELSLLGNKDKLTAPRWQVLNDVEKNAGQTETI